MNTPKSPYTVPPIDASVLAADKDFGSQLRIPPDKSISHRALIFGAMASSEGKEGAVSIENCLASEDCKSTLGMLKALGLTTTPTGSSNPTPQSPSAMNLELHGGGLASWPEYLPEPLDAGNSGTTARLMTGVLAGAGIKATIIGDESLSKRPMRRVTDPLELMGAVIETTDGHLPLTIKQGVTKPLVNYTLPVASAQVKSSLLLAGLTSGQAVSIHEPELSRDHTEYFLQRIFQGNQSFWITDSDTSSRCLQLKANAKSAFPDYLGVFEIPDDPSSMAFWCVLAALVPDAQITFHRASLNPTRIGFIDILRQSGCQISRTRSFSSSRTQLWEPQGELCIDYAKKLKPFTITPTEVPSLIDEVPILMALAATIPGTSSIRGAAELRKKESDRIACVAANLRRLGAKVTEYDDGMDVTGTETLKATEMLTTHGDHRLAMAWLVLCAARAPGAMIDDVSCAAVSYPTFLEELPLKSS